MIETSDRVAGTVPAPRRAPLTVGVEEEFLLAEPASGRSTARASDVLGAAGPHPWETSGAAYHRELLDNQVEAVTGVCTRLPDLARQLAAARTALDRAARAHGLVAVGTGTAVLPGPVRVPAGNARFAEISRRYAGIADDYQVSGCHVHVGVPGPDTAVAVVNHLRPWLPTLLAASANSPFDRGRDTGHASWRMVEQARFPTSGVPPWFGSAAEYDRALARLVDCGVLVDRAMTFWLARPSPRLPTVEVRVADAAASAADALVQAALTRALVRTALDDLDRGREAPRVDPDVCAAALWTAARYGLAGPGVDPVAERRVPAAGLLAALLARVAPALEEAGELAAVTVLIAALRGGGTGAERQRRAASGGPPAIIAALAAQTTAVPPILEDP
ncbi:carboxylate-amine ligase [Actinomadura flavalba]|uniref:carboxylate-amine ligase n=1 Tax=Actinomadura flavalba TaxID=1120938 RepID=UPI000366CAB2|nr:glutamate--cysteine ligase [Actinomadura flavalba]